MKNCNNSKRPKAFLGTLIGLGSLAAGLYSTISNANNQRKLAREQAYNEEHTNNINMANQMNQALDAQRDADELYLRQFNHLANGGRRRLAHAIPYITDGGYAIPIDNHTFLLRGAKHSKGGIGIKAGNKEYEAQGGEILEVNPTNIKVFSNKKMDGKSPAEEVLEGGNKDKIFKRQQSYKYRKGLKDDGTKAALGATWHLPEYIGLGTNVAASVLSNIISKSAYNDIRKYAPKRPAPYYIGRFNTTYNINPQLAENKLERDRAFEDVNSNRASSASALDERRRIGTITAIENNKLYGDKNNKENELVNAAVSNQQDIINKNIAAYNDWQSKLAEFNQGLVTSKLDSNVGMIQGIGSSIGNFLQQGISNYENEQLRSVLLAGSAQGTAELAAKNGYNFDNKTMSIMYQNYQDAYDNATTDEERKTALAGMNFWASRLGPKYGFKAKGYQEDLDGREVNTRNAINNYSSYFISPLRNVMDYNTFRKLYFK